MLTGAFIDRRIDNVPAFYKKSLIKLGIPALIFSAAYSLWYVLLAAKGGNFADGISSVLKYWKTGWLGHPLWYMYMLVGLYTIIPFVHKAVLSTEIKILPFTIILCVWAAFSSYTSSFVNTYNLGRCVIMLSYVFAGYTIKTCFANKNTKTGVLFVLLGVAFLVANGLLVHHRLILDLDWRVWGNNFSPFVMTGSILVFAGFCKLDVKHEIKIAKYTFIIYLFHKGVLEVVQFGAKKILPVEHKICQVMMGVAVEVALVFAVSFALSCMYMKLQRFFSIHRS